MSLLAGLIGGGLTGLGSLASGLIGAGNVDRTNAMNEALTREGWARDDNSVQRRVADLKAAGLSPVLAAGQGASTGAPIKMESYKDVPNVGGATVQGFDIGMNMLKTQQEIARTQADTDRIKALTDWQLTKNKALPTDIILGQNLMGEKLQSQFNTSKKIGAEELLTDIKSKREILELNNRTRDLKLVERMGGRSDMKAGITGQLTEALNVILNQLYKAGITRK